MPRSFQLRLTAVAVVSVLAIGSSGCSSLRGYVHKGFKVGPDYCQPPAAVAEHWIDEADVHAVENPEILKCWWTVFNDPKLNELVTCAYRQNLTLREAGYRILEARATLDIAVGNIFPQTQRATGSFKRGAAALGTNDSVMNFARYSDSWNFGLNLNWELDFWGRFRRAIASADASLDASVADYDYVLVTLLGDVATNYVTVRTSRERIKLVEANVKLQKGVFQYIENRLKAGKVSRLDYDQAESNLRQTEAGIQQLEIAVRQAENALCTLLGIPTIDLSKMLGDGPIPIAPADAVVGVPADLLRRRPDVRKAERKAAAQAEQIGIAQADLYPAFSITGNLGYSARNFPDLFRYSAFNGNVGPSFQWNLLNYGRIAANVRYQDAAFQELVVAYQNTVLKANEEVENGLVTFLRSQERSKLLDESVAAAERAVKTVILQYEKGLVDFNRYATIEQNLVTQQDSSAQARGQIAQGLISVYRALGGGWEIRLADEQGTPGEEPGEKPKATEEVPSPPPAIPPAPKEPAAPEEPKEPAELKEPPAPKKAVAPKEKETVAPKEIAVPEEPKEPAELKEPPDPEKAVAPKNPAEKTESSPILQEIDSVQEPDMNPLSRKLF